MQNLVYFLTKINHFLVSFCHKVVDFSSQKDHFNGRMTKVKS